MMGEASCLASISPQGVGMLPSRWGGNENKLDVAAGKSFITENLRVPRRFGDREGGAV